MPVQFTASNVTYDLMEWLSAITTHPSMQTSTVLDERFATCVSSQNWKPFIVGILAPDNPINFIPTRRIKQEIKKAAVPAKAGSSSKVRHQTNVNSKNKGTRRNGGVEINGSLGGRSADSTDDPSQKIMSYGSSTSRYDPLATIFGRNLEADFTRLVALQTQIDGLQAQLELMRQIPQLILLVNPQEFKRTHENTVDFGVKTRTGNLVHTWFEQPIKINASGMTPSQYAVYADMSGGLTNYNRIHSLSYRNLMSLIMIYKNNGVLYDFPSGTLSGFNGTFGSTAGDGSILLTGSVFIYFDDHVYIGSFDNFSVTDDATKPHNLSYSFSFTVRYDICVDLGADAQLSSVIGG